MSSLSQLSLNNTENIVCDAIHLIVNNDLKSLYEIFLKIDDASTLIGFDSTTIQILQGIADAVGNNPDFFSNIYAQLALKANINSVYNFLFAHYLTQNLVD